MPRVTSNRTTLRPTPVREPAAGCMSCAHATVRVLGEREGLKVGCALGHRSGVGCPDQAECGSGDLLRAIVGHMRRVQKGYRKTFDVVEPDCPNCVSNCCTKPNLNKTPFFGEDAIYYLLIGQPLPKIPRGIDHCVFFDVGCTLPSHLRPHVCIEYRCPFIENPPELDALGDAMSEDAIYLIAVATREHAKWRGAYPVVDADGRTTGLATDRFGNTWNPDDPLEDLRRRYGLA